MPEKLQEDLIGLESAKGTVFEVSRHRLTMTCTLFRDLFDVDQELEAGKPPPPIIIDFGDEALGPFVRLLSEARETQEPHQLVFKADFFKDDIGFGRLPETKHRWLLDCDVLYPLADYLGCDRLMEVIRIYVSLAVFERPVYYLEWASETGCLVAARAAIKEGAVDRLQKRSTDWWSAIAELRPSWQIELSRLRWEQGRQLVNRPDDWTNLGANGRRLPRRQEIMLRDRRLTRAQMAERFEPIPCASMLHSLVWTDGSQDTPWLELFVGARESQINEVTIKGNGVETEVHEEGACSRLPQEPLNARTAGRNRRPQSANIASGRKDEPQRDSRSETDAEEAEETGDPAHTEPPHTAVDISWSGQQSRNV